ncbi:MAG TPA: hypothetical protein VE131_07305, partial [Terriglobales bacterium]|nr:hypothetical protein [Terriglobales bacterium]
KALRDQKVRRSALALAAAARILRGRALDQGVPQELVLNVPQNSYVIARDKEIRLPAEIQFTGVDGGETSDRGIHRFLFFPNGSTLGGEIIVSGIRRSASYSIRLEPLTGRVEVLQGGRL